MPLCRKFALRTTGIRLFDAVLLAGCSLSAWTVVVLMVVCSQIGCCSVDRNEGTNIVPPAESGGGPGTELKDTDIDLKSRFIATIPPGTVIGKTAPEGWTNLVLYATPTLTKAALAEAPAMAVRFAQMFKFTLLARVKKVGTTYRLETVARGFAVDIRGKNTVISSKNTMRASLGVFGPRILAENEKVFENDVRQVARTPTMFVFDAQSTMRQGTEHVKMVTRHALVVDPTTGKLSTFIWLLSKKDGEYALAEKAMQLIPPNMQEARLLSVKRDKFVLGMPTADAFALFRIPQGKAIPYTAELEKVAAVKDWKPEQVMELEKILHAIAATADKK